MIIKCAGTAHRANKHSLSRVITPPLVCRIRRRLPPEPRHIGLSKAPSIVAMRRAACHRSIGLSTANWVLHCRPVGAIGPTVSGVLGHPAGSPKVVRRSRTACTPQKARLSVQELPSLLGSFGAHLLRSSERLLGQESVRCDLCT